MQPFNVIIVDDHALFRRGVADILQQSLHFRCQHEYANGMDFLADFTSHQTDLLLLDVQMPQINGIEILQKIRHMQPDLKVIMLTASLEQDVVLDAIRYGANGFLPKDTLPDDILAQLLQVMQGEMVLHSAGIHCLAEQVRHHMYEKAQPMQINKGLQSEQLAQMTPREQETLQLIAKGLNNKLIARQLGISDGTVKVYVKNLLRILHLHSRLELSVWVHQHLKTADFNIQIPAKDTTLL